MLSDQDLDAMQERSHIHSDIGRLIAEVRRLNAVLDAIADKSLFEGGAVEMARAAREGK
jgi:hypothetical protein